MPDESRKVVRLVIERDRLKKLLERLPGEAKQTRWLGIVKLIETNREIAKAIKG